MQDGETGAFDLYRLPGLYRQWELSQVMLPGATWHIEVAGNTSDGTTLIAVFRREPVVPGEEP